MAGEHNSSGSGGERAEPQGGQTPGSGTQICTFHAYSGSGPCPWCIEAGSGVANKSALAFDQSTKSFRLPGRTAWVDDCPNCASTDLRNYEPNDHHPTGYIWCGACGAKSP